MRVSQVDRCAAVRCKSFKGIGGWILTHFFGTYKKFAVSRLLTAAIKDRQAFLQSLREIFAFDFENVVVGHGDPFVGGGKAKLREAFAKRNFIC